jgi:hypothetical protein
MGGELMLTVTTSEEPMDSTVVTLLVLGGIGLASRGASRDGMDRMAV